MFRLLWVVVDLGNYFGLGMVLIACLLCLLDMFCLVCLIGELF